MMLNVAVMFGGRSVEHEVSVITGLQIIENIDKSKYRAIPVYISKEGRWYTGEALFDIRNYQDVSCLLKKCREAVLFPSYNLKTLCFYPFKTGLFKKEPDGIRVDVAFLAFHGAFGEDGCIQGLLELAGIPYTGPGVVGSGVGMDKIIMKDIFRSNDLPIVNYTWFFRKNYEKDPEAAIKNVESKLNYPVFVKPANLGSSIGITKAKTREELIDAVEIAIRYDRKVIIEEAVQDPLEINCSVMGMDDELSASLCEMPVSWQEFLSYEDKYLHNDGAKTGMKGASRKIPAPIPEDKTEEIKQLAKQAFKALDCAGVARIDFLVERESMKVYINEINTIPGSMAFYLWEPGGVKFQKLIDNLIEIALERRREQENNIYSFDTNLLKKASSGIKGAKARN
ncbi:MAG: D-alanine--D-alanine ligase [Tepidanaerobacteraceae bacterium]|jgi:D-alanine-D-alanine ligase|nr:D-alanine--D-alanine ligase [Tepidanaerobacteraceae bacterium]